MKAVRYMREIRDYAGVKIIPVGKNYRQSCTTLPDSVDELREQAKQFAGTDEFKRGSGMDYILNNPCTLVYYQDGKQILRLQG